MQLLICSMHLNYIVQLFHHIRSRQEVALTVATFCYVNARFSSIFYSFSLLPLLFFLLNVILFNSSRTLERLFLSLGTFSLLLLLLLSFYSFFYTLQMASYPWSVVSFALIVRKRTTFSQPFFLWFTIRQLCLALCSTQWTVQELLWLHFGHTGTHIKVYCEKPFCSKMRARCE